MEEYKCKNCKYFHSLRHNFKRGVGYEHSSCCDMLLHIFEDGDDAVIVEVSGDDCCEMFRRRYEDGQEKSN